MKRLALIVLVFLAIVLPVQAQIKGSHLTFMGIPLNGTISAFQQKLVAKGVKYEARITRELNYNDTRFYSGTFFGEKADIMVNFDPKTKIVYEGVASINEPSKSAALRDISLISVEIEKKYEGYIIESEHSSAENKLYQVFNVNESFIGYINLSYSQYETGGYFIQVSYEDHLNYQARKRSKSNDL